MGELHRSVNIAYAFAAGVLALSLMRYSMGPGAMLLAGILGIFGVIALLWSGWRAATLKTLIGVRPFFVVAMAWVLWVFSPIDTAGMYVKFWLDRSAYDSAVQEAAQGKQPSCVASRACKYEQGSNANLAFPWEGLVDNWIGVVHDPSGEVMDAEASKGVFGGDLLGCKHLNGPYYLCSFT